MGGILDKLRRDGLRQQPYSPRRYGCDLTIVLATLFAVGCGVTDAPDSLEASVVFGFEHFDDEDDEALISTADTLAPMVDEHFEAMAEGWRVDSLTADALAANGVEASEDIEIIGAMGAADYRHEMVDVLRAITVPDKSEHFEQYVEYELVEETDRDCFLAGDCARYDFVATQTTSVALLGEATQTSEISLRWVNLPDGDPVVFSRVLVPEPVSFSSSIANVFQQYQLVVLRPTDTGVRRAESIWVEAEFIGLDVPDYFAVESAARSMRDQAERINVFLDGNG